MLLRSLLGAALLQLVSSQALNEPTLPVFGAWLQSENEESPAQFNQKVGQNTGVFQIAQSIPVTPYNYTSGAGGTADVGEWLIEQSGTDAAVLLTVYITDMASVADQDLTDLGNQLKNWTDTYNRNVFLRWGPEMQGTWNSYGFQPATFVALWQRMYPAIKAIAPKVAIVWAPNMGQNYPYGQTVSSTISTADLDALDTNHDGQVDAQDDPFSPYYPGDDMVDWIGLSLYYKGPNFQDINQANTAGYCSYGITGYNLNTLEANMVPSWYDTYCNKSGKACMIAESGAAYHVNADPGVGQQGMASAWWQACITNTTFYDQFPRLKMVINFEYIKDETDGGTTDLRDYRFTNDTTIASAFANDLAQVAGSFQWASSRAVPSPTSSSGSGGTGGTGGSGEDSGGQLVFQTARVINSYPPTLFSAASSIVPPIISVFAISTAFAFMFGYSFAWKSSPHVIL